MDVGVVCLFDISISRPVASRHNTQQQGQGWSQARDVSLAEHKFVEILNIYT